MSTTFLSGHFLGDYNIDNTFKEKCSHILLKWISFLIMPKL